MKLSNSRRKKAIALSMGLAVAVLSGPNVQAQGLFGDLRDNYYEDEEQVSIAGLLDDLIDIYYQEVEQANVRGLVDRNRGISLDFSIDTEGIGEVPLGGGLVILLGAGLGYAALKRKEEEQ